MLHNPEAICEDIANNLWATRGFEAGVQEQTEAALAIVQEIAADLPNMEGVAVVPTGSRFKGYALLGSDLDLAIIHYDEHATPYRARMAIGKVVTERLGISVCQLAFPDIADEALTWDMVNYGHPACFPAGGCAASFANAVFEGERVSNLKQTALYRQAEQSGRYFQAVDESFYRCFIHPKFYATGAAKRYEKLARNSGEQLCLSELTLQFENAYMQRAKAFSIDSEYQIKSQATMNAK